MQEYGKTIITNDGRQMLTEVDGSKGKITYTRAALYTQNINAMSEVDRVALTALTGELISTELIVKEVKDTTVTVAASFNNAKVTKDTKFYSIGWFAKTSVSDVEKLMATTPSNEEQTLVAGNNGATTTSLDIDCLFGRSHDTEVVVQTTSVGAITGAQLEAGVNSAKEYVNSLSALTEAKSVKNDALINLDNFFRLGITKFTNCQLQSTGQMVGLNKDATNLSGWIFNVPNQIDEAPYQQIVYIINNGSGTQTYVRLRSDVSSTKQEDFEKLSTDRDMARLLNLTQDGVYKAYKSSTVNPNEITETGIYRLSSCALTVKATNNDLSSRYWGWLINLNYENTATSNAIYQILIVNEVVYYRIISAQYKKYPPFDNIAYGSDIAKLQQDINDVDFSSLETKVDAKTAHDELKSEISKRGRVFSVNEYLPGAGGNINLPNFENPNYTYAKNQPFDVDQAKTPGIYSFNDSKLTASIRTDALDGLPRTTDGTTMFGYLVVLKHDIWNIDQFLFLNTGRETPDLVIATRSISGANNFRPIFRRLLNTDDAVHRCDDLASGIDYSKANPNCIVATP